MKKAIFNAFVAFALFGTAFLVSCNDRNTNYEALINKQWNLTEVIHRDSTSPITVPAGVNIIFADSGRVYGNAGCNNINGLYEPAARNQIGISRVASTMMWCPNMEFETAYLNLLNKVVSYQADENRLELEGAGNGFKLIFRNGGPANVR